MAIEIDWLKVAIALKRKSEERFAEGTKSQGTDAYVINMSTGFLLNNIAGALLEGLMEDGDNVRSH